MGKQKIALSGRNRIAKGVDVRRRKQTEWTLKRSELRLAF